MKVVCLKALFLQIGLNADFLFLFFYFEKYIGNLCNVSNTPFVYSLVVAISNSRNKTEKLLPDYLSLPLPSLYFQLISQIYFSLDSKRYLSINRSLQIGSISLYILQ